MQASKVLRTHTTGARQSAGDNDYDMGNHGKNTLAGVIKQRVKTRERVISSAAGRKAVYCRAPNVYANTRALAGGGMCALLFAPCETTSWGSR